MTASIFNLFHLFHHGWFYRGAHRKFREDLERTPRREATVDAFILIGFVVVVALTGLLAVMLAKGW